jgi:hypothetical protein
MDIIFYNNNSENNRLIKTITQISTGAGVLREPCNLTDPSVLTAIDDVSNINYAYIADFGRYYFIRKITVDRENLYRIDMHVDVLMSNKTALLDCKGVINSSTEINANRYLNSDTWVRTEKDTTTIMRFPSGLSTDGNFILITAGG